MFEGRGPLRSCCSCFVGGLALNLTPCVLPMIPINLAIIGAGAQAGSRGRGFMLGSAYGARDGARLRRARPGRHPHRRHLRHHQLVALVQPRHRRSCSSSSRSRCSTCSLIDFSRFSTRFNLGSGRAAAASRWRSAWAASPRCWPAPASRRSSSRWCCSRATCTRPGTTARAGAAVLPRHRHGDSVADRRRRSGGAAEAGHVDGPRQAGVRRLHLATAVVLRLRGVLDLREPLGRSGRGRVERRRIS